MSLGSPQPGQAVAPITPLFRPEVTHNANSLWLGSIRLAQPISAWLVVSVSLSIAVGVLTFGYVGEMRKKAHVAGIVLPSSGTLAVAAPVAGVLLQAHVAEGQKVSAGQVLFTLSTERQNKQGEITALVAQQLATRLASLEAEQRARQNQYQDKLSALNQQLANSEQESAQLAQEIQLAEQRQQLAQTSVAKFQELAKNGYVSAAQVQQKQEDLLDMSSRLSTLKRNQWQLQSSQKNLQAEKQNQENSWHSDLAQLQNNQASVKQEMAENQGRNSVDITAAQAGTITTLASQNGQQVNAGQVLATLIPGSDHHSPILEVQLYAPSRSAGFVADGQAVKLRFAAFPYQKFGLQAGVVSDVSTTPFAPSELPPQLASTILSNAQQSINGFNSNEALYRIKVKLEKQSILAYGQEQALKPGMTVEADVLQDRRKIWEWILEPALAIGKSSGV